MAWAYPISFSNNTSHSISLLNITRNNEEAVYWVSPYTFKDAQLVTTNGNAKKFLFSLIGF